MSQLKTSWLLLLAMLIVAFSCRKYDEGDSPEVVFLLPAENALFSNGSAEVSVAVSASRPLKSIRLSLVNDELIPVLTPAYFFPKTNDTTINHEFKWDDQFSPGEYQIQVLANDGRKEKFKYLKIKIDVVPDSQADLYYITGSQSLATLWHLPDLTGSGEVLFQYPVPVLQLGSGRGNLYLMTAKPSRLIAVSAKDGALKWEKEAGMPAGTLNHFYLRGNNLLLADASGTISMLNATTGSSLLTAHHQPDTVPTLVYHDDQYLYAAQRVYPGGRYFFSIFHRATATFYKRYQLDGAVAGIFQHGAHKVLVATVPTANTLVFSLWDKQDEYWETTGVLQGHAVRRLRRADNGLLLLVSDKGVGLLNPLTGSYSAVYEGAGYKDAIVHPVSRQVVAATGHLIQIGTNSYDAGAVVVLLGYGVGK